MALLGFLKLAALLVAVFWLLRVFERAQVYQPSRDFLTEQPVGTRPFENVALKTSDNIVLHAWFFPASPDSPRHRQVLYLLHGNAGNLSHRGPVFQRLLETGMNIFAIDYRGFGKSRGRPAESGTYLDADAGYEWLIARGFAPNDVVVQGESLGGGIASHLAATRPVGGLILQSTYTSLPDLGSELFPYLPVRTVGKIKYPTLGRLAGLKMPVLVMHSRKDEVIPFTHGERNFAAAREPKLFWELNGGHNDYLERDGDHFIAGIKTFIDRFLPSDALH